MINVLAISITFIPSVLLCGHCQLEFLAKNKKINYKFAQAHFLSPKEVEWADVIVFIRSDSDMEAYVSKIGKKMGKRLVYVLDDDLLNPPSYVSSFPYYNLPSTKKNMRTVMENCDTFLTPSPVLMEKYGGGFKHKHLIAEPSLNRIDKKPKNSKIKIGFAGSIDRAQDLNLILEGTINKLVQKYGKSIDIEFMGAKPAFVEKLDLTYLPYQDGYEAYTAFMAKCNWDIGLAPMPDSEFHRCKYFNKFVEYASFGIAGVYSNLEPYIYGIKDGVNGLLVNNTTDEWFNAICKLIEDEKYRREISKECLRQAKDIYALDVNATDYLEKIIEDFKVPERKRVNSFALAKSIFFAKRVFRKVREHGLNFPKWLNEKLKSKREEIIENIKFSRNTKRLYKELDLKDAVFVIGPVPCEKQDDYSSRIKFIDEEYLKDKYVIYVDGESPTVEQVNTEFLDERHASILLNSYDVNQVNYLISLFEKSGHVLVHGVHRFLSEKLSPNMLKILGDEKIHVTLDSHGALPEKYHEAMNYHTEELVQDLEEKFVDGADLILVENEELKKHFCDKYKKNINIEVV